MTAHSFQASQYAAGVPTAVVPDFIGQVYVNVTPDPKDVYISFGLSAGNWQKVGSFPVHDMNDADWHTGVAGATENNYASFDADGLPQDSLVSGSSFQEINLNFKPKIYKQGTIPTLAADNTAAIWQDTGTQKVHLVFRRGTGDQVSVELGYPLAPP